jgi:hypothetical protein
MNQQVAAELSAASSGHSWVAGTPADANELVVVVVWEVTGVLQSAAEHTPEDLPVLEAGDDRANYRSLDASRDQAREKTGSFDAVGEVVGVEGDDAAHAVAELDRRRQRQRRAHRLARERELGEVEFLDDPDHRRAQRRLFVAGAPGAMSDQPMPGKSTA